MDLQINLEWCKGCGICAALCPKNVLKIENGKVHAVSPNKCIGCKTCELHCPDFAVFVKEGAHGTV